MNSLDYPGKENFKDIVLRGRLITFSSIKQIKNFMEIENVLSNYCKEFE